LFKPNLKKYEPNYSICLSVFSLSGFAGDAAGEALQANTLYFPIADTWMPQQLFFRSKVYLGKVENIPASQMYLWTLSRWSTEWHRRRHSGSYRIWRQPATCL